MDIFPHPEIGKGIFFEYLRGDDPMSMDARNHFADGFPFLLAPLAQVKDYFSRHDTTISMNSEKLDDRTQNTMQKMFSDVLGSLTLHTRNVLDWVQDNIDSGMSNFNGTVCSLHATVKSTGVNLHRMLSDLDKRRGMLWSHFINLQHRLVPTKSQNLFLFDQEGVIKSNLTQEKIYPPDIAKMFGESVNQRPVSDEIGVIIKPTMNFTHMMFLYLVHFYLLLLLIVSVPDSSTTRLVIKRSSDSTLDSDTDHEERCKQLDRTISDSLEYEDTDDRIWNEVPKFIPRFVLEKDGVEQNCVDAISSSDHGDMGDSPIRPMKKAFSYFV
jgi:hypothetical protein